MADSALTLLQEFMADHTAMYQKHVDHTMTACPCALCNAVRSNPSFDPNVMRRKKLPVDKRPPR